MLASGIEGLSLTGLATGKHVHFVNFDRPGQCDRRRVERFANALDAPSHRPVGNVELRLDLGNTRVEP